MSLIKTVITVALTAVVTTVVSTFVTLWIQSSSPGSKIEARLAWIDIPWESVFEGKLDETSRLPEGFLRGLSESQKKTFLEEVRYISDVTIYQVTIENLLDRRSDPIEVAIDEALLAIVVTNPGPSQKVTLLQSGLTDPVTVGELPPYESAVLFTLARKSYDPPDAIKVMLNKQLVPALVERHQESEDTFGIVAMVMNYPNLSNFIVYMTGFILAFILLAVVIAAVVSVSKTGSGQEKAAITKDPSGGPTASPPEG